MFLERTFKLNQAIPLPPDTEILIYQPEQPEHRQIPIVYIRNVGQNNHNKSNEESVTFSPKLQNDEKMEEFIKGQFLAVSPSAASYVVLENELLITFQKMMAGLPLGELRNELQARIGVEKANSKLNLLLRNLTGRNFFIDAHTEEYDLPHPHMQLYVTNRCNLRCTHCYMSSGDPLPNEISTTERLTAITAFAKHCPGGKVTFTGGEALLDPEIFILLDAAKSLGLRVELYSNGLTIKDPKLATRLALVVDEIQVSIDGASETINDEIRGKGTYKRIIRGIRLLDAARSMVNNKFRVRVAITLTSSNMNDIRENISSFIDKLNLTNRAEIRIGTIGSLGRAKSNPQLIHDHRKIQMAQAEIVNTFAKSGMHRMQLTAVNRFSKTCGMGLSLTVSADGNVYPCTITDQKPIGNIRDGDVEHLIKSVFPYFEETKVDNIEGCRDCSIRYACGGICRITNYYKKGSMQQSACTPSYKSLQIRNLIARYESYGLS